MCVDKEKDRPSLLECLFVFASEVMKRSTCARLRVGCLLVSTDFETVFSYGYNGNARGLPNTCDSEAQGDCGCVHAEMNTLLKPRQGSQQPKALILTASPCLACAKAIINARDVKAIYFKEFYRDKTPLRILQEAGIMVFRFYDEEAFEYVGGVRTL